MRLASGDVRGPHRFTQKRPHHRIGATGLCCGRDVKKPTFAEFLVPFGFQLLHSIRQKRKPQSSDRLYGGPLIG
jgi:hypothetical protein